jgi:hypothetical protein
MLLEQNVRISLVLLSGIRKMDGPHEKKRLKANNTLPYPKKKRSYSISYEWLLSDHPCGSSTYLTSLQHRPPAVYGELVDKRG